MRQQFPPSSIASHLIGTQGVLAIFHIAFVLFLSAEDEKFGVAVQFVFSSTRPEVDVQEDFWNSGPIMQITCQEDVFAGGQNSDLFFDLRPGPFLILWAVEVFGGETPSFMASEMQFLRPADSCTFAEPLSRHLTRL